MIYIDLENNPPSQDWIDRAEALTQQLIDAPDLQARNKIIEENESMWGELKTFLANLGHQKCWYTESRNDGSHCHVDHFRPKKEAVDKNGNNKGGYWWLAFDWMNYRYSGPAVNVRKRSYFHVNANKANVYGDSIEAEDILFLDPIEFDDPDCLAFDNEGKAIPASVKKSSKEYLRADYSIYRFNLNDEKLKEGRRDLYRKASNKVKNIERLLKFQSANETQERKIKIRGLMKELWEMCCRKSIYSASVKYCLKSTGLKWALEIVEKAA